MLRKIKCWLYSFRIKRVSLGNPFSFSLQTSVLQEDPRTLNALKSVNKAFDQQQAFMEIRALKAHDSSCKDIFNCKRFRCFRPEPSKIVSSAYIVESRKKNPN
jgi:hypothetical protein